MIKLMPVLLIILAVLARILPHPPNFAPIAALALFGGVYLPRRYALSIPLAGLFLGDLFIGFYGLEMFFVYGSFLLVGLIGFWLKDHKRLIFILFSSLLCSTLFFVITNFGVWLLPNSMYSKDFAGLMNSYLMALPFFRGTMLGDLTYTSILFASYELFRILGKKYLSAKLGSLLF